jgi:hypothetical protein
MAIIGYTTYFWHYKSFQEITLVKKKYKAEILEFYLECSLIFDYIATLFVQGLAPWSFL